MSVTNLLLNRMILQVFCFVDDKDDVQLYSYEEMADAIV